MGRKIKSDVNAGLPDGSKAFHAPTPESVREKRLRRYRLERYKRGFILTKVEE